MPVFLKIFVHLEIKSRNLIKLLPENWTKQLYFNFYNYAAGLAAFPFMNVLPGVGIANIVNNPLIAIGIGNLFA